MNQSRKNKNFPDLMKTSTQRNAKSTANCQAGYIKKMRPMRANEAQH